MNKKIFIIIFVAALFLFSPHFFRPDDTSQIIGTESLYHLMLAEEIQENGYPSREPHITTNQEYHPQLFHWFLSKVWTRDNALLLNSFMTLFGVLATFILYLLLRAVGASETKAYVASILFAISPLFLATYTKIIPVGLGVCLNLLSFYLLQQKDWHYQALSIVSFTLVVLLGPVHVLMALLFLYVLPKVKDQKPFQGLNKVIAIVLGVLFLVLYLPTLIVDGVKFLLWQENLLTLFVAEVGVTQGLSLFMLLLAAYGFIEARRHVKQRSVLYLPLAFITGSLLIFEGTLVYISVLLSILGGLGFLRIIRRKWEIPPVRTAAVIVLIIGLVITSVTGVIGLAYEEPTHAQRESMKWVKRSVPPGAVVLIVQDKANMVQYLGDADVLLSPQMPINEQQKLLVNQTTTVFQSRNFFTTTYFLRQLNISYIWIDKEMKEELWHGEEDGIQFLFRNKESFKKAIAYNGIYIWEFISE